MRWTVVVDLGRSSVDEGIRELDAGIEEAVVVCEMVVWDRPRAFGPACTGGFSAGADEAEERVDEDTVEVKDKTGEAGTGGPSKSSTILGGNVI